MDILNIVLWVLQGLVALAFGLAGYMKVFRYETARQQMAWVNALPRPLIVFIGSAEMLGALGLILPRLTGVLTWLTPLAGAGLALVMLLATGFHVRRHETPVANIVLLALAAFIAVGRFALTA